jgi:Trm5-related predicted tRNA methylase
MALGDGRRVHQNSSNQKSINQSARKFFTCLMVVDLDESEFHEDFEKWILEKQLSAPSKNLPWLIKIPL